MAMFKYALLPRLLLCNLPAPVTVQEETVPTAELQKKQRGKYQHFSPKEKVTIGRYASEHGVANAVKHFKEKKVLCEIGEIYIAKNCWIKSKKLSFK